MMQIQDKLIRYLRILCSAKVHQLGNNLTQKYTLTVFIHIQQIYDINELERVFNEKLQLNLHQSSKQEQSNTSNLSSLNLSQQLEMSFEQSSAIQSNMKSFIMDKQSNQNHQFKPTKVLFLRNLPKDVTEQELTRVLSYQYGFVEKVLIMIQKAHAFLQFDSLETANKCMLDQDNLYIHNRKILVSYSGRDQISDEREGRQTAGDRANSHQNSNMFIEQQESEVNQPLQDSKVLLVSITNIKYPVNADVLFTIFQKYGDPQRIVIFPRQQGEQALVEFQTFEQAKRVKLLLDGQGMYGVSQPANVMKIQFSELQKLEINTQTLKARDFTKQTVGSFVQNHIDKQGDLSINKDDNGISRKEFSEMFEKAYQKVQTNMKHEFNLVSHQSDQEMNPVNSESIFTFGLDQFSIDFNKIQKTIQFNQIKSKPKLHNSKMTPCNKFIPQKCLSYLICQSIMKNIQFNQNVHPHLLFKLFGIYGNVLRVKILFNKRETALIEFEDINQAKTAKQFLNGIQFFSTNIQVNFSKYESITLSQNEFKQQQGSFQEQLSCDYSQSIEHRYRFAGSKNIQNMASPSKILHLSNFPESMSNYQSFLQLFKSVCAPITIKFFENQGKIQAFAKFHSIGEAVRILVIFHNQNHKTPQ